MTGLKKQIKRFLRDEEGQSTMEYILLLLIVVLVIKQFQGKFSKLIGGATDQLDTGVNRVFQDLQN